MIWKMRCEKAGGHYHCTLFSAKAVNQTWASSGTIVVRSEEFLSLRRAMAGVDFYEGNKEKLKAPINPQPEPFTLAGKTQ